jgi:hypothetical protein
LIERIAADRKTSPVTAIPMKLLKIISKPGALVSGWTSAVLCFSAASGFWLAGERGRAICWVVLGAAETVAIIW